MQCRGKVLEPGLWLHQPVVLLEEETKGKRLFFFKFMRGKGGSLICWSLRPGLFMDLEDKEGNIFWLLPISWIISIIYFFYMWSWLGTWKTWHGVPIIENLCTGVTYVG